MTDAEINRAVAERLGWTIKRETGLASDFRGYITVEACRDAHGRLHRFDFATSLDAMAEAEATLSEQERGIYVARLGTNYYAITATATSRALAFLAATQNRVTATKEQTR